MVFRCGKGSLEASEANSSVWSRGRKRARRSWRVVRGFSPKSIYGSGLSLVLCLMLVGFGSLAKSASGRNAKSQLRSQKFILSFDELMAMPESYRLEYVKAVANSLHKIPEREIDEGSRFSVFLRLIWETAHAVSLRCIGGGIFVGSNSSVCGTNDFAGFTCSEPGAEMCNPLLFGVDNNGRAICHKSSTSSHHATTSWCYNNTKPGFTTRMDLVWEKPEARRAWAQFAKQYNDICFRRDYSSVTGESDSEVARACSLMSKQIALNNKRIEEGILPKIPSVRGGRSRSSLARQIRQTGRTSQQAEPQVSSARTRGARGNGRYPHDVSAVPKVYALYHNPIAGEGRCLPRVNDNYAQVLRRNGVSFNGRPTSEELKGLATGIQQLENLLGQPMPQEWHYKINYSETRGLWNQGLTKVGHITVRRRSTYHGGARNVARYIHEFGHVVGNRGWYQPFWSSAGAKSCRMTGYTNDLGLRPTATRANPRRNEAFAETFAAFVVYPDLLKYKCPQVYDFFSSRVFPGAEQRGAVAMCNGSGPSIRQAQIQRQTSGAPRLNYRRRGEER